MSEIGRGRERHSSISLLRRDKREPKENVSRFDLITNLNLLVKKFPLFILFLLTSDTSFVGIPFCLFLLVLGGLVKCCGG